MKNYKINKLFLNVISAKTKFLILNNISENYGIDNKESESEVTYDGCEHLLEYMTGHARVACSLLMKKYGF